MTTPPQNRMRGVESHVIEQLRGVAPGNLILIVYSASQISQSARVVVVSQRRGRTEPHVDILVGQCLPQHLQRTRVVRVS